MLLSGYSEGFRVRAIEGGVKGYLNHCLRCQREGRPLNEPRDLDVSRRKTNTKKYDWISSGQGSYETVLFVPATEGSKQMKNIKQMEEENRKGRRTRIKVVEMSGKTVRNTLARNYPWNAQSCKSEDCFLCTTNTNATVSCRKPGVG